jgi:hypothetical protein
MKAGCPGKPVAQFWTQMKRPDRLRTSCAEASVATNAAKTAVAAKSFFIMILRAADWLERLALMLHFGVATHAAGQLATRKNDQEARAPLAGAMTWKTVRFWPLSFLHAAPRDYSSSSSVGSVAQWA